MSPEGEPKVEYEGNRVGPLAARSTLGQGLGALRSACERQAPVVLLFEEGDPLRPIIIGIVRADPKAGQAVQFNAGRLPEVVEVDGERISIAGADEVQIVCGKSSITLRRNGRIVLRGVEIETHAGGLLRLKGFPVEVN